VNLYHLLLLFFDRRSYKMFYGIIGSIGIFGMIMGSAVTFTKTNDIGFIHYNNQDFISFPIVCVFHRWMGWDYHSVDGSVVSDCFAAHWVYSSVNCRGI